MLKSLKIIVVVLAGALLVGCGTEMSPRSIDDSPNQSNLNSDETFGPIHSNGGWRDLVLVYVDQDVPEHVVEATMFAIKSWNEAAETEVMSYEGRAEASEQENLFNVLEDNQTVIYFDENWRRHTGKSDGVLGTTVWENEVNDENYIAKGDIILNAQSFLFQDSLDVPMDASRIYDVVDTESVLLHEMGHLLGLDHVDEGDDMQSIMHAKASIGLAVTNRELSGGDRDRIQSIYLEN